jgi:hypothetical protein
MNEPIPDGPQKALLPAERAEKMLGRYYRLRGWTKTASPLLHASKSWASLARDAPERTPTLIVKRTPLTGRCEKKGRVTEGGSRHGITGRRNGRELRREYSSTRPRPALSERQQRGLMIRCAQRRAERSTLYL